jgi:hypothetical protein
MFPAMAILPVCAESLDLARNDNATGTRSAVVVHVMDYAIHEYATVVADADGHTYRARAMGRQRDGRTVWEGWLEFSPAAGGGIVRRSPIETTQPNREALAYWASGVEPVYLEGALARAISSRPKSKRGGRTPLRGA